MFDNVINTSPYANSHGADGLHLGAGSLYFILPYMLKSQRCVCLGSGAGFVPKLMAEAQRVLIKEGCIENAEVYLVDADVGPWGRPEYTNNIENYPEVSVIKKLTNDAVEMFDSINYLHVDADHSYNQVLDDLNNYGAKMSGDWAITVHDTWNNSNGDHPEIGSFHAMKDYADSNNLYYINFYIGCGTGLIMPKEVKDGYKEMGVSSLF